MGYRIVVLIITLALPVVAQAPQGARGGSPPSPQAMAPIDLTGYWVSVVNEDWRFRMVTPAPGDYQGVPMTAAAKQVADAWDPAKDEAAGYQCKSYGAPALLRVPEHLHFTWQDERTLHLDTDAGKQTRLFHFGEWKPSTTAPTLQGDSVAVWEFPRGRGGAEADPNVPPQGKGTLKVTTSHLKSGYLRKNGVPYSEDAALAEYFDMLKEHNGDVMLVVTIVVTDPKYLREPFIITSHFKKQPDNTGWNPTACSSRW